MKYKINSTELEKILSDSLKTQREFAAEIGISESHISRLKSKKDPLCAGVSTRKKILMHLPKSVSPNELFFVVN